MPLANPVQEIVIPLVGTREASRRPNAINGLPEKNIAPISYATKGMTAKLITCVKTCAFASRPSITFLILRTTIIG